MRELKRELDRDLVRGLKRELEFKEYPFGGGGAMPCRGLSTCMRNKILSIMF